MNCRHLLLGVVLATLAAACRNLPSAPVAPIEVVRVVVGVDGRSHFRDERMPVVMVDYAPPAEPMGVSRRFVSDACQYVTVPGYWDGGWHPAPQRQFLIVLGGLVRIEVGDGERRVFSPGAILAMEDTALAIESAGGSERGGHNAVAVGPVAAVMIAVTIPEGL